MRYLTDAEIELVAGGAAGDSTVTVYGSGMISVSGNDPGSGDTGGGDPQDNDGGGSGGGGDQTAGGGHSVGDVLGEFAGVLKDVFDHQAQDQEKVAEKFDPSQKLSEFWVNGGDGNYYHGYAMKNGEAFLDVSGDGIVDMECKTDDGGNLWVNTGEGWYEAGSHG